MPNNVFKNIHQDNQKGKPIQTSVFLHNSDINTLNAISKFNKDIRLPRKRYDKHGDRVEFYPNQVELHRVIRGKIQDILDNEIIIKQLPHLERACQILVSSILSPKDLKTTALSIIPNPNIFEPELTNKMAKIIKEYINSHYELESNLNIILKEIFIKSGAYIYAVIPENSIDEIINNGLREIRENPHQPYKTKFSNESFEDLFFNRVDGESLLRPKGFLGRKGEDDKLSLENLTSRSKTTKQDTSVSFSLEELRGYKEFKDVRSFDNLNTYVIINDNFELLSVPKLLSKIRNQTVEKIIYGEDEYSQEHLADVDIDRLLERKLHYTHEPFVRVKTQEQGIRESIGEPMVINLPTESVVPVYVPGRPSEHIGYLVAIDSTGNPLTKESYQSSYMDMSMNNKCLPSEMLQRGQFINDGISPHMKTVDELYKYERASLIYGELIEKELISRFKAGVLKESFSIGSMTEIYRVMFARALQQQYTQILFIPSALVSYLAFDYNDDGLGKSLLDDQKINASLAIGLNVASARANILNSIQRSKYTINLDENDPEPDHTLAMAQAKIIGNRAQAFVPGKLDVNELTREANLMGLEFSVSGNPQLPNMSVDINEYTSSIPIPQQDVVKEAERKLTMPFGVPLEMIDDSLSTQFAAEVLQNQTMLARQSILYQQALCPQLAELVRKIVLNSPKIMAKLEKLIWEQIDKVAVSTLEGVYEGDVNKYVASLEPKAKERIMKKTLLTYIKSLDVTLPRAIDGSIKEKQEKFEEYMKAIDTNIQHFISTDLMNSDIGGEIANHIDIISKNIKSWMARRYLAESQLTVELFDLIPDSMDDNNIQDIFKESAGTQSKFIKALAGFLEHIEGARRSADLYMESREKRLNGEEDSGSGSSDSSSSSDNSSDKEDGSSGDEGFDDFPDFNADSTSDLDNDSLLDQFDDEPKDGE